jgi:hypothetical protein
MIGEFRYPKIVIHQIFESNLNTFDECFLFLGKLHVCDTRPKWTSLVKLRRVQSLESILPNFFLCKNGSFLLLSLIVYSTYIIFLCYKHSTLTTKTWIRRKSKIGRIDSWSEKYFFIHDDQKQNCFHSEREKRRRKILQSKHLLSFISPVLPTNLTPSLSPFEWVCEWKKERERERECVCVCVSDWVSGHSLSVKGLKIRRRD